ncbi:MAG: N-acetylneuraminate synthase family protein [Promethearchaeota archaeon]
MKNKKNIIEIEGRKIGDYEPTFIVAEIGINHNGDIENAKELILSAKKAGADAVKFQTYITEKRILEKNPIYKILKKCELSEENTKELLNFAESNAIIFFSTPFDKESVDLLKDINIPLLKIASFDLLNKKLLRSVAKTGIPIIISRGASNIEEIDQALEIFENHNSKYAILHCISSYPTKEEDVNLNIIKSLKNRYNCPIGYSDHTLGIETAYLSVVAGACIVEKHFTLDNEQEGPDHKLSANPEMFKELVNKIRRIEVILGSDEIKMQNCEKEIMSYRDYRKST